MTTDRSAESIAFGTISFNVPLAAPLDGAHVLTAPEPTHCPGDLTEPKADSGYLCIYGIGGVAYSEFLHAGLLGGGSTGPGASTTGAVLKFKAFGEEAAEENDIETGLPIVPDGAGSFAVTG